ncbi:MAG: hypothetical protein FWF83_03815 [Clostridiales bacterium]|nr:hypothetical protein [Clostridiales bacterium]
MNQDAGGTQSAGGNGDLWTSPAQRGRFGASPFARQARGAASPFDRLRGQAPKADNDNVTVSDTNPEHMASTSDQLMEDNAAQGASMQAEQSAQPENAGYKWLTVEAMQARQAMQTGLGQLGQLGQLAQQARQAVQAGLGQQTQQAGQAQQAQRTRQTRQERQVQQARQAEQAHVAQQARQAQRAQQAQLKQQARQAQQAQHAQQAQLPGMSGAEQSAYFDSAQPQRQGSAPGQDAAMYDAITGQMQAPDLSIVGQDAASIQAAQTAAVPGAVGNAPPAMETGAQGGQMYTGPRIPANAMLAMGMVWSVILGPPRSRQPLLSPAAMRGNPARGMLSEAAGADD